ncbi:MAG: CDP-diacylglycerol--serine O-phosphatidyltransferase [Bacteroidales bacterium]|nr:CDP-diacylglycerol--serine O-phosphatidyltransferase [Bacteroidales bacterium]
MKKHVPNVLTLLNLVSGFIAIILIMNGNLRLSVWLISLSLLLDFADGLAARLLDAYSELGLQLDSLADMVSFGVAPGLLMYRLIASAEGADSLAQYLQYVPVLIPAFTGIRLARFNIDKGHSDYFKGLPTPGNAFFIISLVFAWEYGESQLVQGLLNSRIVLCFLTLVFSTLMITNIPMFSFKFRHLRFKGNELRIVFLGSSLLLVAGAGFASLPLIILLYIIVSVIWAIIT